MLSAVVVTLVAVVGYAVQRELARPSASQPAAAAPVPTQRALTAEEEDYAAALWPIHSEIKLAAVEMSFAGIAYKTGDQDAQAVEARIKPLADSLDAAMTRARALRAPASISGLHDRYLGALALYEKAAGEMLVGVRDGKDEDLVAGQQMSVRATEDILRIGDVLWPGEYKPH